ncbi:MAG: ATP-dependent DNA helicase RecG, partial [Pedobacter sp.]|nr:ATP-dependent DNA helicase RecG [Pedobacter sp.]
MFASTLDTNIEFLKGVGPKRAELLQKELGVFTCEQLLTLYPFRYIDRTRYYKINELNPDLPYVQILGRITAKEEVGEKHKKRIVAKFTDETGTIELVWFQSLKWVTDNVQTGKVYIIFGKPLVFNGTFSISHPELETYPRPGNIIGNLVLQPVYSTTEKLKKFLLDSRGIQKLQALLIDQFIGDIKETIPSYILNKYNIIGRKQAILNIHFPKDITLLKESEKRLKFDELFFVQLSML